MALDPGPPARPAPPGRSGASPAAYAVAVEVVDVLGGRVRAAAGTTEELAARPAVLPAALEHAGSRALGAAAHDFADAWSRECRLLARETLLLADALAAAADHYRSTEWAVGAMASGLLGAASRR